MNHNEIFVPEESGVTYTSQLEEGDYIPYFVYKHGYRKISIQNSAGKSILFVTIDKCTEEIFKKYNEINISTYFICKQTTYNNSHIIEDINIYRLFPTDKIILVSPNFKICKVCNLTDNITKILSIKNFTYQDPPILIVPNVITEEFKNQIIEMFNNSVNKNHEIKGTKNRTHVYMDDNMTQMLDNKLTKSLFPEIKKIFNLNVTYRENYKICGYSEENQGKFHVHRDSVYPYGHRRLAMSLILNDEYEGGGIIFPEYNNTIYKPAPCSAVIFPTPLFHQVLEVSKGTRYVIISFLLGDDEAKYKKKLCKYQNKPCNIQQYKIKIKRDKRNLTIDDICPQT